MTIRQPCIVVTLLCCLLTLATSAFAEGAWTMWMMGAESPWDSVGTFPTREQCLEALHQQAQAVEKLGARSPRTYPAARSPQPMLIGTCVGSASPTPRTHVGRR